MTKKEKKENDKEDFDTFLLHHKDNKRRAFASRLASRGQDHQWTDEDIELLLNELEIEVGEGSYCLYLSQNIQFQQAEITRTDLWQDIMALDLLGIDFKSSRKVLVEYN